mmetsp:Transcript_176696/g.566629  ORF Transcript_176696/g.566629 Transcript_176696/m.566629 type:complete len:273 (-) Transcript_176696:182-1000(-)
MPSRRAADGANTAKGCGIELASVTPVAGARGARSTPRPHRTEGARAAGLALVSSLPSKTHGLERACRTVLAAASGGGPAELPLQAGATRLACCANGARLGEGVEPAGCAPHARPRVVSVTADVNLPRVAAGAAGRVEKLPLNDALPALKATKISVHVPLLPATPQDAPIGVQRLAVTRPVPDCEVPQGTLPLEKAIRGVAGFVGFGVQAKRGEGSLLAVVQCHLPCRVGLHNGQCSIRHRRESAHFASYADTIGLSLLGLVPQAAAIFESLR